MRIKAALFCVVLALAGIASAARAQDKYPDKPIRIMAPYAPGGNIDVTARIIADKLKDVLGVTVLVENKAGASGMIGSDVVARSAPDGYNLAGLGQLAGRRCRRSTATRPTTGSTAFQPISHIQAVPAVLVVTTELADQDAGRLHRARPRSRQVRRRRFRRRHDQPHRHRADRRGHRHQVHAGALQGQRRRPRST